MESSASPRTPNKGPVQLARGNEAAATTEVLQLAKNAGFRMTRGRFGMRILEAINLVVLVTIIPS
jgi:hypothetical protein